MLSRPRSPRPPRRPSPPTTLHFFSTGHGTAAAEGMSGPRLRGNWGLTWAYAQALTGGREPLMQQSGATVAAVDGSNSWCLNSCRSQEMTDSPPCPSPPPVCRIRRSVDRASWRRTRADRAHQRNLLQPLPTLPTAGRLDGVDQIRETNPESHSDRTAGWPRRCEEDPHGFRKRGWRST
jgi:hypothetical protein